MPKTAAMSTRFCLDRLLARSPDEGGMSQSELARRSEVSFVTINAIANNRTRQVKLDTLDKIARVLGVRPGDLLEYVPEKRKR